MLTWKRQLIIVPGVAGATILSLGALIAAVAYRGDAGERYSPLRYFVSELGHTQDSELALLFNLALFIGGLLYALFMVGIGLSLTGIARYILSIGGIGVGTCGALVGVFPMDVNLPMHGQVALTFFEGSLVLMIVFSLAVAFTRQKIYPRWLALVALPMIISNAIFIRIVLTAGREALESPQGGRPDFWLTTTTEWGVIIFLLVWVMVVALQQAAQKSRM